MTFAPEYCIKFNQVKSMHKIASFRYIQYSLLSEYATFSPQHTYKKHSSYSK